MRCILSFFVFSFCYFFIKSKFVQSQKNELSLSKVKRTNKTNYITITIAYYYTILKFSIMTTELVAGGEINDYGSTQKKEELLVGIPGAMMDRNHHHHTSTSNKPPSRPLWKTKKFVVLGMINRFLEDLLAVTNQ